jgi:hypothetical protein
MNGTMTGREHQEYLRLIDDMKRVLVEAQGERRLRPDVVDTPGGQDMAWAVYERDVMLGAINERRGAYGLPSVGGAEISAVESMAMGHSDYTAKFAMYCADLAMGLQ